MDPKAIDRMTLATRAIRLLIAAGATLDDAIARAAAAHGLDARQRLTLTALIKRRR